MATILVVDDNVLNRSVLTTLLGYQGHRLVEAASGSEAIDKTLTEHPELIITDILMPNMDGYELVQKLRSLELPTQAPIIFYSATYLEGEAQALARACGVSQVICKPAEPEQILRVVDEALRVGEAKLPSTAVESVNVVAAIRVLNEKLYQKVAEVERLNETLEIRVAERTRDLEAANLALQKEILERHKAEDEAAQSRDERLKMKGEFLSHVSHELRSPLAVVHQFTTILLDGLGGALTKNQKEYLDISLRNLNQLKYMIDDLLEASRADTAKLTVHRSAISVSTVVAQALTSQAVSAKQKSIKLINDSHRELPAVYADSARVLQVLTNLLDNAIKFSPPDTAVSVRTERFAEDTAFLLVSVADCGCGIDPEHADRVFDRLYQVKNAVSASRNGLGLGLYICKELVTLQGGGIWVNTKRKAGTTFHFTLPVFTIKDLIAPIATTDGQPVSFLVMLTVEVRPQTQAQPERERERMLRQVHQLLERSMLPDLDVLLPVQSRSGTDYFHIVARTDLHGSDVMATRFRDQLSRCRELKAASANCSVSSEIVELSDSEKTLSSEERIARLAAHIKERLKSQN
jgi:signal transduction histidine kinase